MKRVLSVVLSVLLILSFGGASFAAAGDTGFSDVSADSWYADAAIYVRDNGIMSGVSETEFSPDDTMTRAMLTTVLYRMAQSPAVSGDDSFTDTAPGEWYSSAVIWALDRGIVGGYGDGTFGTNDPISREQFATILWRYAGEPQTGSGTGAFADAGDISDYARSAADWAYSAGIMRGDEAGRFNPAAYATRAEAAVILYNYLNTDPTAAPTEPVATPATEPASGSDTNILVAYFSKTGNTQTVAEYISARTGGDLFRIETVDPYPDDYQETVDRAAQELEDNARPALSGSVDNMEQYDTIFIGYPIWWHTAPMAVATFLESYDLTGKTIVPFCTSGGSSISESMELINGLCAGATVLEGLTANGDESEIDSWLAGITPSLPAAEATAEPTPVETGRTLVVYYSATGNTEEAAGYIAAAANADIFELTPVEPYTSDDLNWTDENSRVVYEHDNPDAREVELVSTTVPNWDSYDTVFIGYPIWWGIAAWPVDGFVEANDFTGKTVIPFCTSSSSGLGESGRLLEELAGTGNWLEGRRFSSRLTAADAEEWIAELGL